MSKSAHESPAEEVARLRETLRESERNSRLLVDSIPGLVALLTSAGESNSPIVRSSNTPDERWRN